MQVFTIFITAIVMMKDGLEPKKKKKKLLAKAIRNVSRDQYVESSRFGG